MKSPLRIKVVVLENNPFEAEQIVSALAMAKLAVSFDVEVLTNITAFRRRLEDSALFDIALIDIDLGSEASGSGLDALCEVRASMPWLTIIMHTGCDDAQTIGTCLSLGADDYLTKGLDGEELGRRLLMAHALAGQKRAPSGAVDADCASGSALFAGRTMQRIAGQVPGIIASAIRSIFIHGETGVGKEVVADIFEAALPLGMPFLRVNCGTFTSELVESELFGHVKGAFTGALRDKRGLLEQASGGFIFLDEVATLSKKTQIALLRVVENQEVLPVGSDRPRKIDVRFLSATNEDIEALVAAGSFRLDLWQRLNEKRLELPPLRERCDEIPDLIAHFCRNMPGGPYRTTPVADRVLSALTWRAGNVRELRNCLRSMTEMHSGGWLTPQMIPEHVLKELQDGAKPEAAVPVEESAERGGAPSERPSDFALTLHGLPRFPNSFDELTDSLFCELLHQLMREDMAWSLADLSLRFGLSKSALSRRLSRLIQCGRLRREQVARRLALRGVGLVTADSVRSAAP